MSVSGSPTAWRAGVIVYGKELRDALRDRRTLAVVLASSVLLGPLVMVALSGYMASAEARAERRVVVVDGLGDAPALGNYLARQTYQTEAAPADYRDALRSGRLQEPVVAVPPGFEAALQRGEQPTLQLVTDSSNARATGGVARVQRLLLGYAQERATMALALRGVAPETVQPFRIDDADLANAQARGAEVTGVLPFFVIMAVLVGAMNAALDTMAGERERGSLDPLLLNPVPRAAIVAGKWAAVSSLAALIAVLSCISFLPAQRMFRSDTLQALFRYGPREAAIFIAVLMPLAAALSAVLMAVAARCRTFKEAQANSAVVTLAVSLLPLAPTLIDGAAAQWQWVVPALGQYSAMTRVLKGQPLEAMPHIVVPAVVCLLLCAISLLVVARRLRAR